MSAIDGRPRRLHELREMFLASPWVPGLEVGGHRLGTLLDRLALFEMKGGSPRPLNAPAVAMQQASGGALALRRVTNAIAGASRAHPSPAPALLAFSSAPTPMPYRWNDPIDPERMGDGGGHEAFGVLRYLDGLASLPPEVLIEVERVVREPVANAAWAQQLLAGIEQARDPSLGAQVNDENAVLLSPSVTALLSAPVPSLLAAAPSRSTRWLVEVIDHELQHTTTPARGNEIVATGLDWLEEGAAELLARWPGAAERMARDMGLPRPTPARPLDPMHDEYDRHTDIARRIAALAGLDISRPDDLDGARALFQAPALGEIPGVLAAAIITNSGIDDSHRVVVRDMLARSGGDPEQIAMIERYIAAAGSPPSAIS